MTDFVNTADTAAPFTRNGYPVRAFITLSTMPLPPVHTVFAFPTMRRIGFLFPRIAAEGKVVTARFG